MTAGTRVETLSAFTDFWTSVLGSDGDRFENAHQQIFPWTYEGQVHEIYEVG